MKSSLLRLSVFLGGFASILVQLTLLRELMSVFYGNELVFGIVLGMWVMLTGVGSLLGMRFGESLGLRAYSTSLLASGMIIPATVFASRIVNTVTLNPGEMMGLTRIIASSAGVMGVYCIIYGLQIVLASSMLSREYGVRGVGGGYVLDNLGDVFGGFMFSILLVYLLDSTQVSYVAAILCLAAAVGASYGRDRTVISLSCILIAAAIASYGILDLQSAGNSILFSGQEVMFQEYSPYGNIVVTSFGGQINFFENSVPVYSTQDVEGVEEVVHYPMSQVSEGGSVLLVSGGFTGVISELLKHKPRSVDYVELDPTMIDVVKKYAGEGIFSDSRVSVLNTDGRLYVKRTDRGYDAVIVNLPDPTTAQLNRFYTIEFMRELKSALNPGGVVSLSLSSSENYMNEDTRRLNAVLFRTLREAFKNVIVIPGETNRFIASDRELSYDIGRLLRERGVEADYVNEAYLKGVITEDRVAYVMESLDDEGEVLNSDFKPVGYYYQTSKWLDMFGTSPGWMAAVVAVMMGLAYMRLKPVYSPVFSIGFAGMTLEVALLIAFQAMYGSIYQKLGIVITSFMAGVVLGAHYANRRGGSDGVRLLRRTAYSITAYSLILPALLSTISMADDQYLTMLSSGALFPLLAALLGAHVGAVFPTATLHAVASGDKPSAAAGRVYSLDLAGAFFGAILASTIMIPLYGVYWTCFLTAAINLLTALRLR
ncbi:MAG: hypothetical protein ABIH11_04525 [Candidatus Altiarchaeota archaeon]